MKLRASLALSALRFPTITAFLGLATTATAQLGSGWQSIPVGGFIDYETHVVHHQHSLSSFTDEGAKYTKSGSMERFEILDTTSNRVEHDTDDHYNTGKRQFEGYVQIYSGVSAQSVVQIFGGGPNGPILMIKGYGGDNGRLDLTRTSQTLISNIFGTQVRVNLIHDCDAHNMQIYINGSQAWSGDDAGDTYTGSYNLKYGCYGTLTTSSAKTEWSNVKLWKSFSGYYKILNRNSGKAMNVENISTADGAHVIQWTYSDNSSTNDEWQITDIGSGYCKILNRNSGKALNVEGVSTADGANLIQWTYSNNSTTNDEWQISDIGGGYYKILNRNSGKAANVENISTADGAQIIQWTYSNNSNTNDEWQIIGVP